MSNPYQGVHLGDSALSVKKRTQFIPWTSFMSIGNIALDGNAANIWITEGSGTTAGVPLVGEIGATSTDVAGISMAADGDLISTYWPFPADLDTSDPGIELSVHFVHETVGDDDPIFKVHYLWRGAQEAFAEPVGGATAVTTMAVHVCSTTADSLEITDWDDAATAPASTDVAGLLAVECDDLGGTTTQAASADEIKILGLNIRYNADILNEVGPS